MIIGHEFVWIHFPKCGGTLTHNLLQQYFPDILDFDTIDPKKVIWHDSVAEREKRTGVNLDNKVIISGFRRLPRWIMSRVNYELKRTNIKVDREEYIYGYFYEASGIKNNADAYIKKYYDLTQSYRYRWIRLENLEDDFRVAFKKYLDVDKVPAEVFQKSVNRTEYDRDIDNWFSELELQKLYKSNPIWTELEKKLYGNLLVLPSDDIN